MRGGAIRDLNEHCNVGDTCKKGLRCIEFDLLRKSKDGVDEAYRQGICVTDDTQKYPNLVQPLFYIVFRNRGKLLFKVPIHDDPRINPKPALYEFIKRVTEDY